MAPSEEPRNPFYLLLLLASLAFAVTAVAYAIVPVIEEKARDARSPHAAARRRAHRRLRDRHAPRADALHRQEQQPRRPARVRRPRPQAAQEGRAGPLRRRVEDRRRRDLADLRGW